MLVGICIGIGIMCIINFISLFFDSDESRLLFSGPLTWLILTICASFKVMHDRKYRGLIYNTKRNEIQHVSCKQWEQIVLNNNSDCKLTYNQIKEEGLDAFIPATVNFSYTRKCPRKAWKRYPKYTGEEG